MRSFQIGDAETIGAMVSDGRITTDILVCRALPQSRIRDNAGVGNTPLGMLTSLEGVIQFQDACDRYLPDTAQASFGRGIGRAAAAVAGGSFGCGRGTRTAASVVGGCSGCSDGVHLASFPLMSVAKVTIL